MVIKHALALVLKWFIYVTLLSSWQNNDSFRRSTVADFYEYRSKIMRSFLYINLCDCIANSFKTTMPHIYRYFPGISHLKGDVSQQFINTYKYKFFTHNVNKKSSKLSKWPVKCQNLHQLKAKIIWFSKLKNRFKGQITSKNKVEAC